MSSFSKNVQHLLKSVLTKTGFNWMCSFSSGNDMFFVRFLLMVTIFLREFHIRANLVSFIPHYEKSTCQDCWSHQSDFCLKKPAARWAPTSYKWSYSPYKWPYKWVTGVITPISGVITLLITGRGPTHLVGCQEKLEKPVHCAI